MPELNQPLLEHPPHEQEEGAFKVLVLRIPSSFDGDSVKRILEDKLLTVPNSSDHDRDDDDKHDKQVVKTVTLMYKREEDDEDNGEDGRGTTTTTPSSTAKNKKEQDPNNNTNNTNTEHRGFAFVTFNDEHMYQKALALETVRGGRKATSTKKHTLYIKPYNPEEEEAKLCFLWAKYRCPYGDECKFLHQGPGGCLTKPQNDNNKGKAKPQKCLEYKKKGKCTRTNCPFSHDFTTTATSSSSTTTTTSDSKQQDKNKNKEKKKQESPKANKKKDSEKDCINWKTKGKCRKGDNCPYKHDEALREAALQKKRKRTQQHQEEEEEQDNNNKKKQQRSKKQPLWVRIFGLNYETQENDVREFLQECGPIVEIQFPRFEDSGRSKGYCGVLFQSPKAVEKALELDGAELHGRWLRIQAGKMLLEQWEGRERQEQAQAQQQQEQQMDKQAAQQDSAEG